MPSGDLILKIKKEFTYGELRKENWRIFGKKGGPALKYSIG